MTEMALPQLVPAIPEILLLLSAMILLMVGVFQPEPEMGEASGATTLVSRLALGALLLVLFVVWALGRQGPSEAFYGQFVLDDFAVFFKIFIVIASGLCLLMGRNFLEQYRFARFEYPVLVLFATAGMMMMVSANDLISLYIGLELQSLALYVLAAFRRDELRSTEAGLKYFVLGAVASCLLLYGASLVYGFTGSTNFTALADTLAGFQASGDIPAGIVVGIVFVISGLAFKVSAVPFHMWAPDVYEGAPTPVTAFFSVAPKLAAFALFLRVLLDPFGPLIAQWQQVIVVISIASMILGAFAAIGQKNIKRLMAYSSISHVGYALIGLAVGSEAGARGVMIYLVIYVFMNMGVFACILSMSRRDKAVENMSDLAGLSKTHPAMALALAVFMFSMAGIPPLAGFFGKLYIFLAAVEAEMFTLAVIGVLSSVVAAYYYLRIVKIMYFEDVDDPLDRRIAREVGVVMIGTGVLIALFFLFPDPLLTNADAAANALFAK